MIPRKAADVRSWQQIIKTTTTLHTVRTDAIKRSTEATATTS